MKHAMFAMMAALGVAAYSGHAQAASNYAALDISALVDPTDTYHFIPGGLNDLGQVVGARRDTSGGGYVGFVTGANGSGFTNLPTPAGYRFTYPAAINNQGQMASKAYSSENYNETVLKLGANGIDPTFVAYFGKRVDLSLQINERGQIAGAYYDSGFSGDKKAFLTGENGVGLTELGNLGGNYTGVTGLNDFGQVVGLSRIAGNDAIYHAYITGADGLGITDLGTLGGAYSSAAGINNSGQVVGMSSISNDYWEVQAFITGANGAGMTGLLVPDSSYSVASAINDSGVVVGMYVKEGTFEEHGFITGPDGVSPTELKAFLPEGVHVSMPKAINNQGQVLVQASNSRHYLLTPVPEPEVTILALCGLGMVAGVARRRGLVRPAV